MGLGLDMKNVKFILILAITFLLASCLKKTDLNDDDLGDAVAPELIADALGEGFGTINYSDIKAGEKTRIVYTQALQAGSAQPVLQQDITINSVSNDPTKLEINLTADTTDLSDNSTENDTLTKSFTKYSGYAFADDNTDNTLFLFETLQNIALGACYNQGSYPETCHNLVSQDISFRVSASLATQHPTLCPDVNNCSLPAKQVDFDLVRHYEFESDGKPRRIHYTLILSREVPFTSRVLKYCTRSLYTLEGYSQKVLADLCYSVNSYTFGP